MAWNNNLTNLRNVLAALYSLEGESRRIVDEAGLNELAIPFNSIALTNWHNILKEADKQGMITEVIDTTLRYYPGNLLLQAAREGTLTPVRSAVNNSFTLKGSDSVSTFERLIGEQSSLLPVSWLEVGAQRARSVAKIILPDNTFGSGFLIRNNFMLTNNHVLPTKDVARTAIAWFNFQQDVSGRACDIVKVGFAPDAGFETSREHDWTIVRVNDDANARWGALTLEPVSFAKGDYANIIQHPAGQPKHVACYHNVITFTDEVSIEYLTDTLPGSSGSPVFDNKWRVIAIHYEGGIIVEKSKEEAAPKKVIYPNKGVNINCIVEDLNRLRILIE
jgi:V8-like Glu-specific endopeptidase